MASLSVCVCTCVWGGVGGGRSGSTFVCISSHNRKCLTASPSQWLRFCFPPLVHFFLRGVPPEDWDREDECPLVTIRPCTLIHATHAPQNLPTYTLCNTETNGFIDSRSVSKMLICWTQQTFCSVSSIGFQNFIFTVYVGQWYKTTTNGATVYCVCI